MIGPRRAQRAAFFLRQRFRRGDPWVARANAQRSFGYAVTDFVGAPLVYPDAGTAPAAQDALRSRVLGGRGFIPGWLLP